MTERIERLREKLKDKGLAAVLVMQPENRRYLSGFTGTAGALLIDQQKCHFLVDFRYLEQAGEECPGWQIYEVKESIFASLAELLPQLGISSLACEGDYLTCKQFNDLRDKLVQVETIVPLYGLVEEIRKIKDPAEIENLRRAAELADHAFWYILDFIRPGVQERDVALALEFFLRKKGARKVSFDFIVASGTRGAMPHGVASEKTLQAGELVTIDYGCEYQGYYSDITRTVSLGPPDRKQAEIYGVVLEAQATGLRALKAGVKASEVDQAVRDVTARYGYQENYRHSTGHGVGLAVHEAPRLAKQDETVLEAGMVVTIEPGIYLPGWGGVRIEDMAVVEEHGCRLLTHAPKEELIVCG
ncbi:MAG: Xaa-Pro peptidase family protein [Bacillota bacterium]